MAAYLMAAAQGASTAQVSLERRPSKAADLGGARAEADARRANYPVLTQGARSQVAKARQAMGKAGVRYVVQPAQRNSFGVIGQSADVQGLRPKAPTSHEF